MADVVMQRLRDLGRQARAPGLLANLDYTLIAAIAAIGVLGIVMVASASVAIADRELGSPLYLLERQLAYAALGIVCAGAVLRVRLEHWQFAGGALLVFGYFLLVLVLVPGVGREANGSVRWLPMVAFNLQVSEVAKVSTFLYLAGYLVRRGDAVRNSARGFLIPVGVLGLGAGLLLLEPDFGAAVVLMATGMAMIFIAGAPLWRFLSLVLLCGGAAAGLVVGSPYRWERFTAFLNPWADPFDSGFQLTQSLIAIGRGEWFGVGLGNSVQKLFYLPEAHTDFLFAVLAEELGLVGVITVVALYGFVVWRSFSIARRSMAADRPFGGYLAYGIGTWLGIQAFVNMGVNMGLLPTKGLTLPLMSYGGSSLVMSMAAMALLLRADHEVRVASLAASRGGGEVSE
ncbi:MAG: putative lipid II flippase FtsW [Ectothiorhodospiraceae bacterium]|jgi:cell division protein FtsW